jgi:uncharacterized membrane protein
MKETLLQTEVNSIEEKIKHFETETGCDLLLVFAKSADDYPAAAWRFGVISGFLITFVFSLFFDFTFNYLWPLTMTALILIMSWVGHFSKIKRYFLSEAEVEKEFFEKALECFHTLGTSKVSHKVTAMIMVSVLERRIIVLVDEVLKQKISQQELDELVILMQKHFKEGHMGQGLVASIESLEEKILKDFGGRVASTSASELSDQIHFI